MNAPRLTVAQAALLAALARGNGRDPFSGLLSLPRGTRVETTERLKTLGLLEFVQQFHYNDGTAPVVRELTQDDVTAFQASGEWTRLHMPPHWGQVRNGYRVTDAGRAVLAS